MSNYRRAYLENSNLFITMVTYNKESIVNRKH